jgi:hypothetical protein
MSIDKQKHIPRVWVYKPDNPLLLSINLEHDEDPFDWTGRRVKSELPLVKDVQGSAFVSLMLQEVLNDTHKTQDGSDFLEKMQLFCKSESVDELVQNHLAELFKDVRFQKE